MLFDFLWKSKPAKIKLTTIIAPISEGGLGMVDVYNVHLASKINWIERLPSEAKSKSVMLKMMNVKIDMLNKNVISKL